MNYRIITAIEPDFFVAELEAETVEHLIEQMTSAGYEFSAFNSNPVQRAELQGQPKFKGLCGPMWDGDAIRYECRATYAELSA
ncbi:MAG: hypothetical protein B7X90_11835 [Novosphingobium sp. 17-62-19]|nr:MAG: hypothetical protein B7Y74_01540 [Novosphingobium sp. 35-62-5]OZA18594.1 MAG: hypothetical protein B7X90_11835 [Novosphingobium sp. 17-62-19]